MNHSVIIDRKDEGVTLHARSRHCGLRAAIPWIMRIFAGIPGQLRVKPGASVAYRNDETYYVCFLQIVNSNTRGGSMDCRAAYAAHKDGAGTVVSRRIGSGWKNNV